MMYPLFFAVFVQLHSTAPTHDVVKVSPPIIMPQELVTVTDRIIPPPVTVIYK